jgi:hypothetical protein
VVLLEGVQAGQPRRCRLAGLPHQVTRHRSQHRGHRVGIDTARDRMPPKQQLGLGAALDADAWQQQQVDPGRPDGAQGQSTTIALVG